MVAVQYPGRQDRLAEPCLTTMDELADAVAAALDPLLDRPLALFGHSMGASLAHEVALRLPAGVVELLLVSARLPPRHHSPRLPSHDDQVLLADVRSLDPEYSAFLDDPDMREVMLPSIRADYRIADTYRPSPSPVVDAPVVAYLGGQDPSVSVWQVQAWSEVTKSGFDSVVLPGHHFYLRSQEARLVGDIAHRLEGISTAPLG
jgi:pyochelin biosynthesis protein PchC